MINNTQHKVAIIIPTLNEERYIVECLHTIIQQSYSFELMTIYVVDGGSSDATCDLVKKYTEDYSNIFLLKNDKKIQSAAFNIGVKKSVEPYVIRLDAHARYDKYYIEKCIMHLRNNVEYGNVGGKISILRSTNTIAGNVNAILNTMRFALGGADFRVGNIAKEVETVPFGAFCREVIENVGLMDETLPRGEDNEYNARIIRRGYKIFFDPEIKCKYYARPTFSSSINQMFDNGFSIGVLLRKSVSLISYRHLIPLLFTLFIIVGGVVSYFCKYILTLYLIVLSLYWLLNISSSVVASLKNKQLKYMFVLPIFLFVVHISYGIGTIKGLIVGKY